MVSEASDDEPPGYASAVGDELGDEPSVVTESGDEEPSVRIEGGDGDEEPLDGVVSDNVQSSSGPQSYELDAIMADSLWGGMDVALAQYIVKRLSSFMQSFRVRMRSGESWGTDSRAPALCDDCCSCGGHPLAVQHQSVNGFEPS